ncbi:MAG: hypothetical protein EOP01_02585, partial [Propionibacteriaceae bacterium]
MVERTPPLRRRPRPRSRPRSSATPAEPAGRRRRAPADRGVPHPAPDPRSTTVARPDREAGALDWFTRPSPTSAGTLNLSFNALDRHVVRGLADEPALLDPGAPTHRSFYSFAGLLEQVGQLGGALRELGVVAGGTVVLALPLGPELVFGLLACARLGAVAVPLTDEAPGAVRRLGHDPAVDRPTVVLVDGPRRAAVDEVLAAAGRAPDHEVVREPGPSRTRNGLCGASSAQAAGWKEPGFMRTARSKVP